MEVSRENELPWEEMKEAMESPFPSKGTFETLFEKLICQPLASRSYRPTAVITAYLTHP